MRFWDIVMTASTTPAAAGGGGGGTFPFAPGTIGFETDWILTGDFSWDAGTSSIRINGTTGSATLTGSALTAFNAAIANSTVYNGEITVADYVDFGQIGVAAKEGAAASFETEGDGIMAQGVESGTGSGLVLTVLGFAPDWRMTTFTLTPA